MGHIPNMSLRRRLAPLFAFTVALGFGVACDPDEDAAPECGGEPELISAGDLPDTAAAGDMLMMAFEVEYFEFSMEGAGHDHDHDAHDDGGEEEKVSAISDETGCYVGHVHVYLDDLMTDPLAQITTPEGSVMLPDDIEAGDHRLILRLHDATHRIIEPQVILEHMFTVQ